MLKDSIIQILNDNRDRIKNSFGIDDNDINNINEFLNIGHDSFKIVIDDISTSNLSDRGKMTLCCIIGYTNGIYKTQLFGKYKNIEKNKEREKK